MSYVLAQHQEEGSLKKRYLYKLGTNFIGLSISLVTASIIPRGLGPAAYGDFNFLTDFFSRLINFFDGGTSTALFTKLSQRLQEQNLLKFYWVFVAILSSLILLFVSTIFAIGLDNWLWPGQTAYYYIWMAAIFGLLTWYTGVINKVVDAYGLTVSGETARIQQKVLGITLILLMFWLDRFSLTEFYIYHYLILLFLGLSWWRVLKKANLTLLPKTKLTFLKVKNYSQEFYEYASPLVVYAFVGLLVGVLDRWLLQTFAGSVEQGFYSLAYKIGAICFLFTSAMTPLLTREFSRAYGEQNSAQMQSLFYRYIPVLYSIAAFFAVFVAVQADKVGVLLGGNAYQQATAAVAIMAFYPIHQTYGQLSGSIFLATGQTKLYRNLGISMMLLSVPVTFWLIAPKENLGLDLGATGLAMKMVVIQFISINLQLWFNTKFLNLSFLKLLGHQFYTVILLIIMAWLVTIGIDRFIENTLLALLTSGFIYALGFMGMLFLFPALFLMSRAELMRQLTSLKSWRL